MAENEYREQIKSELKNMKRNTQWKVPVIFGALKPYRDLFWALDERKDINEKYHKDLETYNGFPVKYLNIFRVKTNEEPINSFFYDIAKDADYLIAIICNINRNIRYVYEIVELAKTLKDSDVYYEQVHRYMYGITMPSKDFPCEFHRSTLKKDTSEGDQLIRAAEEDAARASRLILSEEETVSMPTPQKQDALTPESIGILLNALEGLETADEDTLKNLEANYIYYVLPEKKKKFLKTMSDKALLSRADSLFFGQTENYRIEPIRQYYEKDMMESLIHLLQETQREAARERFMELLYNIQWNGYEHILYFVDLLSYFYKKNYKQKNIKLCVGLQELYRELNAAMRSLLPSSPADWYCFDPEAFDNWGQYCNKDRDSIDPHVLFVTIDYVLRKDIIISSSVLLDVLDIACKENNFKSATKKVDEAIKRHKTALSRYEIFF